MPAIRSVAAVLLAACSGSPSPSPVDLRPDASPVLEVSDPATG